MSDGRRWLWAGVGVVSLGLVIGACSAPKQRSPFHDSADDAPEFSATHLGDPFGEGSAADFLGPQERAAVETSGVTWTAEETRARIKEDGGVGEPQSGFARTMDTAGKVTMSLVGVGITVGAAVAPFFLF